MIISGPWSDLRKISFVAHSVGGIVARYAIVRLYMPPREKTEEILAESFEEEKATIGGLVPMNFITFAIPHLGSRGHKQVLPIFSHSPSLRCEYVICFHKD